MLRLFIVHTSYRNRTEEGEVNKGSASWNRPWSACPEKLLEVWGGNECNFLHGKYKVYVRSSRKLASKTMLCVLNTWVRILNTNAMMSALGGRILSCAQQRTVSQWKKLTSSQPPTSSTKINVLTCTHEGKKETYAEKIKVGLTRREKNKAVKKLSTKWKNMRK
jgi:hypothetical protein